jgi:hypothetical protein
MGPEDARGDDMHKIDIQLDELLSREGPKDRSDDLYDGDW